MKDSVEYYDEVIVSSSNYNKQEEFTVPEDDFIIPHFNLSDKKINLVRIILGRFGNICKMSAPKINITTEGSSLDEAWSNFLLETRKKNIDTNLLTFVIGPTTRDEIINGLNIPEDEDWSETIRESEDD